MGASFYASIVVLCVLLNTLTGFRPHFLKPQATTIHLSSQSSLSTLTTRTRQPTNEFLRQCRDNCSTLYSTSTSTLPDAIGKTQLKLITFNVLAPCYKRELKVDGTKEVVFESSDEQSFLKRKSDIIDTILSLDADIINLQEYWFGSDEVQKMFREKFNEAGYYITELR